MINSYALKLPLWISIISDANQIRLAWQLFLTEIERLGSCKKIIGEEDLNIPSISKKT